MSEQLTREFGELIPLAAALGVSVSRFEAAEVRVSLQWAPGLCTAGGALHGGVIMALADSAGGACAYLNLPAGAQGTTTVESKTNFLRAVREGMIEAASRILHAGRTLIVVETEVRDAKQRLVAKVTQTQFVL